jgi:Arabinose efflux permease
MGTAYIDELVSGDRVRLRAQMQAYGACDDPEICKVVRDGFGDLVAYAQRVSGVPAEKIAQFFATGMMLNVLASMQVHDGSEPWAKMLLEGLGKDPRTPFFTTEEVMTHTQKRSAIWTVAITSVALFMVSLDNLVVTTALPVIRHELNASISQLEWTVNAYTLTFAVLLLTGAALGDRFGRRRMFVIGLLLFTVASAAAALSTSADGLDIARALQGVGGAIVTPLTLTILSAAVPAERRGLALGIWGGIGGLRSRSARSSAVRSSTASRGTGSSGSTSRSGSCSRRSRSCGSRRRRVLTRASTCPAWRSSAPACSESSGGS